MRSALLLLTLLGIVAYGLTRPGGVSAIVARRFGRARGRALWGWAAGTALTYGGAGLAALALLGRLDAVLAFPPELAPAAGRLGLAAAASPDEIAFLLGALAVGAAIGVALLLAVRRLGGRPIGPAYRSPAAMRSLGEAPAAAALAVAAGVGEELFFRLALPLLAALATGSALAGVAIGWVAFVALHRHQGRVGLVLVALVATALTWLYLLTGTLWLVALLHVAIDLNALVLRPWLFPLSSSAASRS